MGILNKIIKTEKKDDKKVGLKSSGNLGVEKKENEVKTKVTKKQEEKKESKKSEKNKISASKEKKTMIGGKVIDNQFDIIKKPHISEKAFNLSGENKYVFVVLNSANKTEIKKAIQNLYKVSVVSVNIINTPSKPKRFKGIDGARSGYRKAVVTLAKGNTIDTMKEA